MIIDSIYKYLGPGGSVERSMEAFESRPQQLEMAQAIGNAFDQGNHLMIEAGTGTGKSLAYLIPAVLWATKNNKKVVISTYTKTLQQQILNHDIPFLQKCLGISFRYSLCVGHNNYLSLRRLERARQTGLFQGNDSRQVDFISKWSKETTAGLRGELPFEVMPSVWEDVGRQKELCLGNRCPTYETCFYFKARRKWFASHILIVNHHLFFANIASGGGVLPRFDGIIFDEAQNIEETATRFLGLDVSNDTLFYFLDRLYNPKNQKGILSSLDTDRSLLHIEQKIVQVRQTAALLFNKIFESFGHCGRSQRLYKPMNISNTLYNPLRELQESLILLGSSLESDEDQLEIGGAATHCLEFNESLETFLEQRSKGFVYWLEIGNKRKNRQQRIQMRGVPIDISLQMQDHVFAKTERITMTSATLSTNNSFEFVNRRIGFKPQEEVILESPFNYAEQTIIYIPSDMLEPIEEPKKYYKALSHRIIDLIELSGGRTFILFTSYDSLNRVHLELESSSLNYPLLKQGELSARAMIEKFKRKPSVILGTNSFWQGIDIPGNALQSVIITKLPFDVPSEPIIQARIEELSKMGVNPFLHYQLPRAILQLKQGFGRLIRKKVDRGVVSLLDPRIVNRSYGKQFIDSLPNGTIADDLSTVREFFKNMEKGSSGII